MQCAVKGFSASLALRCTPLRIQRQKRRSPETGGVTSLRAIQTKDTDDAAALRNGNEALPSAPMVRSDERAVELEKVEEESAVQRGVRIAYRRILLELSSLPRSMGVMSVISLLSAIGTIVEQDESFQFYVDSYPDADQKMLGFLTYKMILFFQLDHIYSAPYFYALIALLVAQLVACTHTRQWPIAKVAKRWRFAQTTNGIAAKGDAEVLPDANVRDLGVIMSKKGYEVFLKNGSLYGFKSLVGRFAPIGVHASLLITIAGICWGVLGGYKGSVLIPEGREIVVEDRLRPNSPLAVPSSGIRKTVRVNDFTIEYRSDGSVSQFYSDLSVINENGKQVKSKKISVNDPLRFDGVTMYQTDWGMAALRVTVESDVFPDGKRSIALPMAVLKQEKDSKFYAAFIPLPKSDTKSGAPSGISVLAEDFQTVVLFDVDGQFAGVRRPGSGTPIDISGLRITVDDIVGSTGLEMKYDPGVPLVYTGFGALMITTILSYLSHSQIWALQKGRDVHVAGKSNRLGVLFNKELSEILDLVPDSGLN